MIPSNTLKYGTTYILGCKVTAENGSYGYNGIILEIGKAPYGGALNIYPTIGNELDTVFAIRAVGFKHIDVPLRYRFSIRKRNTDVYTPLTYATLSASYST